MADFNVNTELFGRYAKVPTGYNRDMHIYKVVTSFSSNTYCDVPIVYGTKETLHDDIVHVANVIHCGLNETEVIRVSFDDIELLPDTNDEHKITGETSDGYHTFNELYHHRAVLFSVICNSRPDIAWKSLQHDNPEEPMYEGMFICGIDTPEGQATYHYNIEPYWNMFHVPELKRARFYDGHTSEEAIRRIGTLSIEREGEWTISEYEYLDCSECGASYYTGAESTHEAKEFLDSGYAPNHCPNCGAKMRGAE